MSRRFGFFPYGAMDYKAAQAYLDRKAAQGWALKWVRLGFLAQFEPAEGRSHFVDLDLSRSIDDGPDPDYLRLCADAGWEKARSLRGMVLFRSLPGARPVPIQTDDGLEQERFWKGYVRKNLLSTLLAVLFGFVVWWMLGVWNTSFSEMVLSNGPTLFLLSLILILVGAVWNALSTVMAYLRSRTAGRLVASGRWSPVFRGTLSILSALLLVISSLLCTAENLGLGKIVGLSLNGVTGESSATLEACEAYPVVLGRDLGLDPERASSRYLDGRRSFLSESFSYSELVQDGHGDTRILTTERYDCAGEALARWLIGQRRLETERGDFLWGNLPWTPAPGLGFDESYTTPDGSYLLLRQGDTVALVGCTGLDLTELPRLAALRDRLGLEGAA